MEPTSKSSLSRKFITQRRAMSEFMLLPSQMEDLPVYTRRSPYNEETSIAVFSRADVVKRAMQIWGSLDALILKRVDLLSTPGPREELVLERRYRFEGSSSTAPFHFKKRDFFIILAVGVDVLNFVFKLTIWLKSRSDSVFAEVIHSGADTFNQSILLVGVFKSRQAASEKHPYGYLNVMYVLSLISGVAIFCLGGAINCYNGVLAIIEDANHVSFDYIYWDFLVLLFSFVTEIIPLIFATISTVRAAKVNKVNYFTYVFREQDPSTNVIMLEDMVAVLGNLIAALMLYLSWHLGNFYADAAGSIIIGLLLTVVAITLIISSSRALVGRSISAEKLESINKYLESDIMIRGAYDVKGINLGENKTRYKAEIDFDGAELSRLYLDHIDIKSLFEEVKGMKSAEQLEDFLVKHGENIVDLLGSEIDRIEKDLRTAFPEIRHVDLEIH